MLNIGPMASGEVPEQSVNNLLEVGKWLKINGEAIYGTRKWTVTHEGPTIINMEGTRAREEHGFQIRFSSMDFWFTQKDKVIYAMALEYPENEVVIESLKAEKYWKINNVKMLGLDEDIIWKQTSKGLEIDLGSSRKDVNGYALKIELN